MLFWILVLAAVIGPLLGYLFGYLAGQRNGVLMIANRIDNALIELKSRLKGLGHYQYDHEGLSDDFRSGYRQGLFQARTTLLHHVVERYAHE